MTRLPGLWPLQVRGRVTGFFDRTSLSCRKTGRIHAATLRAFLHPPAASYGDPEGKSLIKSLIKSRTARRCRATRLPCRSALVRDQPTERCILAPRSRTSALLQMGRHVGGSRIRRCVPLFVGAHPVCERRPQGGLLGRGRAQGALLQGRRSLDGGPYCRSVPCGSAPCARQTYGAGYPVWQSRSNEAIAAQPPVIN